MPKKMVTSGKTGAKFCVYRGAARNPRLLARAGQYLSIFFGHFFAFLILKSRKYLSKFSNLPGNGVPIA